ncbi:hypothetical protein L249_5530 [Ophiocordyceps polyrhachis-furcata BCC 54312]|uniref:Inosine triphosphate pyrophosphatase n=1 Tax=Ophiocordyceps polyrhachis-furcata BCC 54312 TaxID=1330021 RepID=A0A367LGH3_9HYPO|nr:hypothetical protein L249_5530 [Ophiocordyceps polyrhachis-furcata BCC 54312]
MRPIVTFVTGNANKLREVKAILEPSIQVESKSLDIDEIQGSIDEITEYKCRRAAELLNGPVLVEDTALCFAALGSLPGPYIKHFLTTIGHDGLNNLVAAYADKSAEAVCTFGYSAGPNQKPILFQGRCPGTIVPPRGPARFGWDPVFEYQGQTFAEMDASEKNSISHRARALEMLKNWFLDHSAHLDATTKA